VNIGLLKFDRGKISLPCENSAGWAAGKISTSLKIHNHQRVKIALAYRKNTACFCLTVYD
jgi:hypothetical protein